MFSFLKSLFGKGSAEPPKPEAPDVRVTASAGGQSPAAQPASKRQSANGATRHVIVGAGPAGVVAAETLRARDPNGDIVLLHGEAGEPYSRMAIPYVLTGQIDEPGMILRKTPGWYEDRRIDVRQGWVKGVDAPGQRLAMADGSSLDFDTLLIATGSTPLRPPIEGVDLPGVHTCWTTEDARAIVRLAEPGSHVILLGAGFIGCIVLEALAERGVTLTVVEMGDRMVPRMLDATAGTLLKTWCEQKGISVRTSTKITKIERATELHTDERDSLVVDLDDGTQLPAHLVVIAAGVRASTDLLQGSEIIINQGIVVDNHLRTNVPYIYAAGDCAEGPDFSTGGHVVHAVQPTAVDHGFHAACNMAGGNARYAGSLVMNVLDTVGLVSCSFGQWDGVPGGESTSRVDEGAFRYVNLQFADGRLIGGQTLGRTDWVGVLRGLIQGRIPLGPWQDKLMHDPHRLQEAYLARVGH